MEKEIALTATAKDLESAAREAKMNAEQIGTFLQGQITLPKQIHDPVFFIAQLEESFSQPASTIPFSNVIEEAGSAYNNTDGVFNSPSGGLYHFSCTVLKHRSPLYATINIFHNTKRVCRGHDNSDNGHHNIGCSVPLLLKEGDKVYVKLGNGAIQASAYSTFSGMRVYQIN